MTVQIATADDAFRARNPIKDEVDGALYTFRDVQFELVSY